MILLLIDVAILFCRVGRFERSMLESPLLECLLSLSSDGSQAPGKAHAKPLVGAAAMGSGAPDTFRGFGLMTGATRGIVRRGPPLRTPSGDSGEVPLGRGSPVIPRWCCKLETRETLEPCWLSYGDDGLVMLSCVMPTFIRLSTLLRLESANWELASTLSLWS
jgi:hypothetical protein